MRADSLRALPHGSYGCGRCLSVRLFSTYPWRFGLPFTRRSLLRHSKCDCSLSGFGYRSPRPKTSMQYLELRLSLRKLVLETCSVCQGLRTALTSLVVWRSTRTCPTICSNQISSRTTHCLWNTFTFSGICRSIGKDSTPMPESEWSLAPTCFSLLFPTCLWPTF